MWKEEYRELYFNPMNEKRDIFEAQRLKLNNMPKFLFKYTKAEYAIEILKDDFIKVSDSLNANDPFEGDLLFDDKRLHITYEKDEFIKSLDSHGFELTSKEKAEITDDLDPLVKLFHILHKKGLFPPSKNLTIKEFEKHLFDEYQDFKYSHVDNINKKLKEQIVFISLSEHQDIPLLWSHYADSHRGVCIGYNILDSEYEFFEEICHPIFYVDESDFTEEINKMYEEDRNKLKLLEEPFLVKSKDWSYECEWRLLLDKNRLKVTSLIKNLSNFKKIKDGLCFIKFPKPTSVFLGLNIAEKDKKEIIGICKEREINVYQMIKGNKCYVLEYFEL